MVGEGGRLRINQPSLAVELKKAGYRTTFLGPWRFPGDDDERAHGFDYSGSSIGSANDFLKQRLQNPFFLFVALDGPRITSHVNAQENDRKTYQLRPNVPEELRAEAQAEYAVYTSLRSALDQTIGDLLNALDEQRLAGETIVVFTSDYGEMLGSQGLEGADAPFEEAARIPLTIRHPRLSAAEKVRDFPISNVDLMPTLLTFCEAQIPGGVQGRDLSSLIAKGQGERPESIYSLGHLGAGDEWRMVVQGLDKLVVDRKLEVTHLYNLGEDPFELENHADDPSQELKRDELKALLENWMRRTGDGMDASGLKKRA